MSNENNLEKRLATLEQIVADIQRQIAGSSNCKNWLEKVGCCTVRMPVLHVIIEIF